MASPTQQESSTGTSPYPMRKKRIEEKEELAYLNDRFLSYIEQVRQMKECNLRLEIELQSTKEQLGSEADNVKALYEAELTDARNLIDETAKEKARQQIIASKSASRVEELEAELKTLRDEFDKLESRLSAAERNAASFDAQRKAALSDKHKLQKQVKDLEAELDELRSTVDALKESLEVETLSKVDLQNNIQSLREELAFKRKVYEEELASLRHKLSISATNIVEGDFTHLEGHMEGAIDDLRFKSDQDIAQYKQETEEAYRDKLTNLEAQSARDAVTITRITAELRKINSGVASSNDAIAKLQKQNDRLEAALRQKEEENSRLRLQHGTEMTQIMEELRELRANYELKMKEYQELMDVKVQLDQEIATYRALLQEEETRLNLTPTPREKRTRSRTDQSSEQRTKKPRVEQEVPQTKQSDSTATGFIQICDVEPSGKYVQIKNMSNQLESLGGFKIHHSVEGGGEVVFRFHARSKLQAGASVTVWASKAEGAKHNPPADIVWRAQANWGAGNKTITRLVSNSGEEMATFTQRSEASPSRSYQATHVQFESVDSAGSRSFPHIPETTVERDSASITTTTSTARAMQERHQPPQVGDEHMFHQQGDPRPPGRGDRPTDRCRIS